MATGRRRFRPYRASTLYAKQAPAPSPQAASILEQFKQDHLGGEPSAAQSIVLSLLSSAVAKHQSVSNYLRQQPHPWVNRRSNRAWQIVTDLSRLEVHVAKLVQVLCDPNLERKPLPVEDLASYIARKDAEQPAAPATPSGAAGQGDPLAPPDSGAPGAPGA